MSEVVKVTRPGQRMTCSLCHRSSSPIYLSSCFHSFCPDCLHSRVSVGGQNRCPICQTAINLSETANREIRESISPNGNLQTVRIGGDNSLVTSRSYVTDSSGNLINVVPSSSSDNLINVIQTSPNTRSYVLSSNGLSHRNRDFSRTYVAASPDGQEVSQNQSRGRVNVLPTTPTGVTTSYGNGVEVTRTRITASPTRPGIPLSTTWIGSQRSSSTAEVNTCEICQDGRKATNFCSKCEQYFCQTCSTAHLKMKASRYHELQPVSRASISHPPTMVSARQSLAEYCSRHGSEITVLCKRCNMMICDVCKSQDHVGHMTRPVSEEANEVRKNLTTMLQRQITLSEKLKLQITEAEKRKDLYPRDLDQELGKLNHQIEEMQVELEREREKAADELATHYRDHATRNTDLLQSSQRNYTALMEVKAEALDILNSNDDVYVASKGAHLQRKLDNIERECRRKDLPSSSGPTLKFFQGEIDPGKIRNMVGGITTGTERYDTLPRYSSRTSSSFNSVFSSPRSDTSNLSSTTKFTIPFTDGIGYVYGIAPVDPNKAWITLLGHTSVMLVARTGNVINSVRLGDIAEDVAHDGVGGCYVTCPGSKCIKHVTSEGIVTTIVDDLCQDPHGIAFNQFVDRNTLKQELYVCFTESMGTRTSLFEKPKGSVHVLDNTGADLGRGFHMQSPTRIDIHPDSNLLCISDHSNGCVTVSDKTGQNVHALYTGNGQDSFKPLGVCFDDNGLVIIADWKGEQVIRLDRDGSNPEVLVRDLKGPQSVAFKSWYLWVGGKHGAVHVYQMAN